MATSLETLSLRLGETTALLAPSRGGILTRLAVGGRDLFYLEEPTLLDTTANVRGGNPVLFPSPGKLHDDRFTFGGRTGSLIQHGFARHRPWHVAESSASSATLTLASDETTLAQYPWRFSLAFRYDLTERGVRLTQRIENHDDAPMPFAMGFHPYFPVADAEKGQARVPTQATRAFDNVQKKDISLSGDVLFPAGQVVDLVLYDHGAPRAFLDMPGGQRVVVSGSAAFRYWVIWTTPGKGCICLEPWTAPPNGLNGPDVLVVPPGGSTELWTEIAQA